MTGAVFEAPTDQELEEIRYFVGGTVDEGEEGVRTLVWSVDSGSGEITYDGLGRSVRVLFLDAEGEEFVDVFREGAFRLRFVNTSVECEAVVEFGTDSLSGTMRIHMLPSLAIHDSMLLT
ncbi:hypothetical protein [Micromonospora sp. NPDC023737]|uniref:hypothetical protein n=1 Tax=unclassified Micromonospora TaxID=2617518 RepID=UPI0033CF4B6E